MKCKICQKEVKRLGRHIVSKHNISLQKYYDQFLKKDNEDICPQCGKKKKFGRDLTEGYSEFCCSSCSVSSDKIQSKMRSSCKKHYGVENPLMLDNLKKEGMLKKYGVNHPSFSDIIKNKRKKTLISRYGVDHPSKIESIKVKKIETQILHFGDLYCRTTDARHQYRENFISNIENQHGNYRVQIGRNEKEILDVLEKCLNIRLERSFRAIGYFIDGYNKEIRIAIEIDENHHEHSCYINRDINRELELSAFLGCLFFRIKEKDWAENKEQVISNFKTVVELMTGE